MEVLERGKAYERLREVVLRSTPAQLRGFLRRQLDPEVVAMVEGIVADLAGEAPPEPGPLSQYVDRPAAFCRDFVDGLDLTHYQAEALDNLVEHGRESLRGPHGLGKTALAAGAVLWFSTTREAAGLDWKIPTTASKWEQLTHYLWPEIRSWAARLKWDAMGLVPWRKGRELLQLGLKLAHGQAFASSPKEAASIEGAHARELLYVFDESKTIPDDIWNAAEGAFSGAGEDTDSRAYALAISTAGEPNGRFYAIHRRAPGTENWHARHVRKEEVMAAGRMSAEWVATSARLWGPTSATYMNRVEGEFASSDTDAVIPLAWVEEAQERWRYLYGPHGEDWAEPGPPSVIGVDCSGSGGDRTVLAKLYGQVVGPLERPPKAQAEPGTEEGAEEMATAGRIIGLLTAHPKAKAIVDVVGIGSGVVGRAREKVERARVQAFSAGRATERRDRTGELGFADLRSAAWWNLRELLDPENGEALALPPDDELTGDLTAPHWRTVSGGKIRVEPKDDLRKRLGRSTDAGDAVVQALWPPLGPATIETADGLGAVSPPRSAVPGRGRGLPARGPAPSRSGVPRRR